MLERSHRNRITFMSAPLSGVARTDRELLVSTTHADASHQRLYGSRTHSKEHQGKESHMRKNKTKAKIAANQCAIGVSVAFPSPDLVELCAAVGFDFVTFDCEHE